MKRRKWAPLTSKVGFVCIEVFQVCQGATLVYRAQSNGSLVLGFGADVRLFFRKRTPARWPASGLRGAAGRQLRDAAKQCPLGSRGRVTRRARPKPDERRAGRRGSRRRGVWGLSDCSSFGDHRFTPSCGHYRPR